MPTVCQKVSQSSGSSSQYMIFSLSWLHYCVELEEQAQLDQRKSDEAENT